MLLFKNTDNIFLKHFTTICIRTLERNPPHFCVPTSCAPTRPAASSPPTTTATMEIKPFWLQLIHSIDKFPLVVFKVIKLTKSLLSYIELVGNPRFACQPSASQLGLWPPPQSSPPPSLHPKKKGASILKW